MNSDGRVLISTNDFGFSINFALVHMDGVNCGLSMIIAQAAKTNIDNFITV